MKLAEMTTQPHAPWMHQSVSLLLEQIPGDVHSDQGHKKTDRQSYGDIYMWTCPIQTHVLLAVRRQSYSRRPEIHRQQIKLLTHQIRSERFISQMKVLRRLSQSRWTCAVRLHQTSEREKKLFYWNKTPVPTFI